MDTLYWTRISPNIKIRSTSKQFFSRYTWKIVIYAPGARSILSDDISTSIENRIRYSQFYHSSSWRSCLKPLIFTDINLLETLKQIKSRMSEKIKVTIEEPYIRFYAEDELVLKEIASHLFKFSPDFIKEVFGPLNEQTKALLQDGVILTKKPNKFEYKILLKNGKYSLQEKQQIYNYLENLKDQVELNEKGKRLLSEQFASLWGTFFYTNDTSVAVFLNLISPGCISNIHRLVYQE